MSVIESPSAREEIRKWITERVKRNWNSTGKALLLSRLGIELRNTFPNAQDAIPEGLKEFLVNYPVAKIVSHPIIREKIGLVPIDEAIPEEIDSVFSEASSRTPGRQAVRYFPSFWRAFFAPVTGKRRFVIPPSAERPLPMIKDDLNDPDETAYEILPSDVVTLPDETPLLQKIEAVRESIRSWLARNGLSEQMFFDRAAKSDPLAGNPPVLAPSPTAFASALARLEPSELARIFVPLDLVQRMLSERR